ncbi:MAG: hypothetical protein JWP35_3520 [Caulobacter sp.]|nr:hypothetical protein [Caulobacter sp.]
MTWKYDQSTGDLFHDGKFVGTGYSGAGRTLAEGRNNGALEGASARGPIPCGKWKIAAPRTSNTTGPVTMNLDPVGHDAHGRTLFRIHGDNREGNASHGCIILARPLRELIAGSGDADLVVVA